MKPSCTRWRQALLFRRSRWRSWSSGAAAGLTTSTALDRQPVPIGTVRARSGSDTSSDAMGAVLHAYVGRRRMCNRLFFVAFCGARLTRSRVFLWSRDPVRSGLWTHAGAGGRLAHLAERHQEVGAMLTRRSFLKLTGISTLAWYVATSAGWAQRAVAQIPGGTLDPSRCRSTPPRYWSRRSCPGRHDHACRVASGPTTTRSRCDSSPSRSCPRACRRRPSGDTALSRSASRRGLQIITRPR